MSGRSRNGTVSLRQTDLLREGRKAPRLKSVELAMQGRDNPRERRRRDQDRNAVPVRPLVIIETAELRRSIGIEVAPTRMEIAPPPSASD